MTILPDTYVDGFHDKEMVKKTSYTKLGETGINVSRLSLGGAAFGGVYGRCNMKKCEEILETALKSGINYVDTAPFYGDTKSESVIGEILESKEIPRSSFYISTKIGRYIRDSECFFDFSGAAVTKSIGASLGRLRLNYVDIVIVHDVEFAPSIDIIVYETLPALDKLKSTGKFQYIGISGYPLEILKEILERSSVKIDIVLTYCHYSLNDTSLLDYIEYFKSKGVGIINASPLSMGLLSADGPPPWHPASQELKTACKNAIEYTKEKNVDISKLAIHFSCNNKDIHTTLVSSTSQQYIINNFNAAINRLTEKEELVLEQLREISFKPTKTITWDSVEAAVYSYKSL